MHGTVQFVVLYVPLDVVNNFLTIEKVPPLSSDVSESDTVRNEAYKCSLACFMTCNFVVIHVIGK